MFKKFACLIIATLLVSWIPGLLVAQDKISPRQLEFFEKKIRPVLVRHCYSCHSKDSKALKGGLALDTREGIRVGGDSGHGVVPGDLDESQLIQAIRYESYEMPPNEQLPADVIADFEKWVKMGAPDPRDGPSLIKREINFEEAKEHWAYQPIRKPKAPKVNDEDWPRNEVDQFVLARLEKKSLTPVKDASRLTLVRRLYYDLLGLPPTPEQLKTVMEDQSPRAIERLVDQLLASPQFGENWGRHWLDVVRYAESNGRERNYVYPNAWRYRDYVIDAFNRDKPFDEFVREQVAGDLLTKDPSNEQLVATGFLAIGPKLLNEGKREVFVMDLVDEQLDVTTRAFMGLTVSCARCHDHKFDPIPTAEYYSMAGIFRSTETLYGTKKKQGNRQGSSLISLDSELAQADKPKRAASAKADIESQLAKAKKRLRDLNSQNKKLSQKKGKKRPAADVKALAELKRQIAAMKKRTQKLQNDLKQVGDRQYGELAMGVRDGKVADSPIYIRGEVSSPKGKAPRGFLTILDHDLKQPILTNSESGRKELAEWIVDSGNSLTSRVTVNRVWSHLFGEGIVKTEDNFGASGELPSHPELLDFLATKFVEDEWSVKKLVRFLVTSRTYQLGGQHENSNYEIDPDNRLLWRHSPKRVQAEFLRDAMLLASGRLDLKPAKGSPVSNLTGEYGRQSKVTDLISGNRNRSVYLPIIRNAIPDALKLFDFAEPSIMVGDRSVTTVPTQALFFLNSRFVTAQADSVAKALLANETMSNAERLDRAYRLILARPAESSEIERGERFVESWMQKFENEEDASVMAWSGFCQALFGSAEFRYVE